jgi:hypothetical protein
LNKPIKALLKITANTAMWCIVVVGCARATGAIADLYMILIGGAHPGDVIYLDTLAPPTGQAALDLLLGVSIIAAAFLLRGAARRWYVSL